MMFGAAAVLTMSLVLAISFPKHILKILPFAMLLSLFLLPNITIQNMNFRFEDYLVIFITLLLFLYLTLTKGWHIPPAILLSVLAYGLYSTMITVVHILFGGLKPVYFLFWIKEIQYFIYFVFMIFVVTKYKIDDKLIKTTLILSIMTLGWGGYQLITQDLTGYYGIGIISETASSQSGGVYFAITIFFIYLFHKQRRFIYALLVILSAILTVATISRTSIMALGVCLGVYFMFTFIRWRIKKWQFILLGIVSGVGIISFMFASHIFGSLLEQVINRLMNFSAGAETRFNKWERLLGQVDFLEIITGRGKGFSQVLTGSFTLSTDSQYVRLLLEVGVIGSILWMMIIASILYYTWEMRKIAKPESIFLVLITLGFLVMSITHEVFTVVIQASIYWTLAGVFIGRMMNQVRLEQKK